MHTEYCKGIWDSDKNSKLKMNEKSHSPLFCLSILDRFKYRKVQGD